MKYKYVSNTQKAFERYKNKFDKLKNKNTKEILLIDGTNLFLRNFEATVKEYFTSTGDYKGGLLGSLFSINSLINKFFPYKVYVFFDGKGGSRERRKIYPEYKLNRKHQNELRTNHVWQTMEEKEKNAIQQLQTLITFCDYLPITTLVTENYESDDAIAFSANTLKQKGYNSIIVSTDRDFLQLIDDNISVYSPIKQILYNEQTFIDEFGFEPKKYIWYKIMEGDKSDNIPKVKGIGLKTFLKIYDNINEKTYNFEYLFEKAKEKDKSVILESKELLELNYKLMQLNDPIITTAQQLNILQFLREKTSTLNIKILQKLLISEGLYEASKKLSYWYQNLNPLSNKQIYI